MAYGEMIIEKENFGWVRELGDDIEIVVIDTTGTDTIHMSKDNLGQLVVMLVQVGIELQNRKKERGAMKMHWNYFRLVGFEDEDVYKLVDEDDCPLMEDGSLVLFVSYKEADQYLRDNNIRGSIQ